MEDDQRRIKILFSFYFLFCIIKGFLSTNNYDDKLRSRYCTNRINNRTNDIHNAINYKMVR